MIVVNIANYGFMTNALLVGFLISLLLPFIGIIVLLRRLTFIADSLGHINMSGIAFSILLSSILANLTFSIDFIIIIWSILGSILIEFLRTKYQEYKEISITIVYSLSVAMTMVFLSLSSGYNASFFSTLFGNINAISINEIYFIVLVEIVLFILIALNYKKILLVSLEEEFAKMYGIKVGYYRYLIMIIITLAITIAIKVVGVLLVSSLLTIPILTATRIAKNLKQTIFYAIIFTQIAMIGGIIIAFYLNIATSAVIVIISLILYLLTLIFIKRN